MLCKAEQSKPAVTEASMFRPFLVATVLTSILFTTSPARAQFFDPCLDPESWCSVGLGALLPSIQFPVCEDAPDAGCGNSDGDGLPDGVEALVEIGTDPTNCDTDGDGLSDGVELLLTGTDPLNPDTDEDGVLDGADPTPTVGGTTGPLEDSIRALAASISSTGESCFSGGSVRARETRRTNLAASISMAADMAQAGRANAVKGILTGALAPIAVLVICPAVRDQITAEIQALESVLVSLSSSCP